MELGGQDMPGLENNIQGGKAARLIEADPGLVVVPPTGIHVRSDLESFSYEA